MTAVPFDGDLARVKLDQPGAYKLIAVMPKEDGTSAQEETTIVVKRIEDVPPITMKLDKEEFSSGERLTGVLQSRFADARALLTLRDSTGIRMTKPITFVKGVCRLDEKLPAGLRYGCTVDVIYPDDAGHAFGAHAFTRVVPADQILNVKVETPGTVSARQHGRAEPERGPRRADRPRRLGLRPVAARHRGGPLDGRPQLLPRRRARHQPPRRGAGGPPASATCGCVTFYEKAKKMLAEDDKAKQKKLSPAERQALRAC